MADTSNSKKKHFYNYRPVHNTGPKLPIYKYKFDSEYSEPSELIESARQINSFSITRINKIIENYLCGVYVSSIFILPFSLLVGLTQITVGYLNKTNCSVQPNVPVWLFGSGCLFILFSVFHFLFTILACFTKHLSKTCLVLAHSIGLIVQYLCLVLIYIWVIVGSVWVYTIYFRVELNDTKDLSNYCDKLTYWYSFSSITVCYALTLLILFLYAILNDLIFKA